MFENLLHQNAAGLLKEDFLASVLPPSVLFSGSIYSGKLTAALELARVLSCEKGSAEWSCTCSACVRHKSLVHQDLLLLGPKNCTLEISAAAKSFMTMRSVATRYLFVRSVRKLLLRFHPVLWTDDEQKLVKAVSLITSLNEQLEEIDTSKSVASYADPAVYDVLVKHISSIVTDSGKLESGFLPDSVPVSQVRNLAAWAHLTPSGKRKVVIVENADKMAESSRNAFLKILEEPPESVQFILTTANRGAVMPTILSRVRTYAFVDRLPVQQKDVLTRVFHDDYVSENQENILKSYFYDFLPVSQEQVFAYAVFFLKSVLAPDGILPHSTWPSLSETIEALYTSTSSYLGQINELHMLSSTVIAGLNKFEPRVLFTVFLNKLLFAIRKVLSSTSLTPAEILVCSKWGRIIRDVVNYVSLYNQTPSAALEILSSQMLQELKKLKV